MAVVSTLFRFVTVRNPRRPTKLEIKSGFVRYSENLGAPLLQQVAKAKQNQLDASQPARGALLQLIGGYRSTDDYLRTVEDLEQRFPDLADFADWLAENATSVTAASLQKRLEQPPSIDAGVERVLWDNLLAHTFSGGMPETREAVIVALRAIYLMQFAREHQVDDAAARRLATATVLLPSSVQVNPEHTDREPQPPGGEGDQELKAARERLARYEAAHADVTARYQDAIARLRAQAPAPPRVPRKRDGCMEPPPRDAAGTTPADPDAEALQSISGETRQVLEELRTGSDARVPHVLRVLEEAAAREGRTLWAQVSSSTRVVYSNGSLWARQPPPTHSHARVHPDGRQDEEYGGVYDRDRCRVKPLGIGDFRRVEQEIWCYEPGEVAHVENVMQGETRERTTRFLRRTEQIFVTETEEEVTKERDTQTTDRFEMEKETEKVVKDDIKFDLGVQVTAQYGLVKIEADTKFALSHSTSESDHSSSKYAKEVTDKALERVVKRVREEQTKKLLEEYEETNKHVFANAGGAGHIVGLYRWVNKIYLARIVNYGKRLMLEFMVPEPAAFHLYAMTESPIESTLSIEKPVDPRSPETLAKLGVQPLTSHKDLTATNYAFWAAAYDAKAEPPPEKYLTVSKGYNRDGMDHDVEFSDSKNDLKLPAGYQAMSFTANFGLHSEGSNWITVMVGTASTFSPWGGGFGGGLSGEDDFVPVVIMGKTRMYGLSVEVVCEVKPETTTTWQIKTFAAIVQAYRDRMSAYQTALAEARVRAGSSQIRGTNPLLNRQIEQAELKKGCIRLMDPTCDPLASEAMKDNQDCNYPEFDCCEAIRDGRYVQFLEQAIEWKLMTYLFYPYFWGRKCNWTKIYQISDPDPVFQAFLQAGYAKVVVPVRENYDQAVLRFLADGTPWNGGSTPGIDSPLYVAIANEMKEPVGTVDPDVKPWEITVPTTLTVLQCDSGCVPGSGLPCARDGKP